MRPQLCLLPPRRHGRLSVDLMMTLMLLRMFLLSFGVHIGHLLFGVTSALFCVVKIMWPAYKDVEDKSVVKVYTMEELYGEDWEERVGNESGQ